MKKKFEPQRYQKQYTPIYQPYQNILSSQLKSNKKQFMFDGLQTIDQRGNEYGMVQFDGNQNGKLSLWIIEENAWLKGEVNSQRQVISILQQQLKNRQSDKIQHEKMQIQIKQYRQVIQQLRDEIVQILDKNKLIDQDMHEIRDHINRGLFQTNLTPNKRLSNSLGRKRMQSFQSKENASYHVLFEKECYEQQSRLQEFIGSIKAMYSKIMGFQATNLKELWRWLKKIGHTYRCLSRWHKATTSTLTTIPTYHKLYEMILQGISLSD